MEFGLFYSVAFSLYGSHALPTSIDWGVFVSASWGIGDGFRTWMRSQFVR
jgi:hypothetical protein